MHFAVALLPNGTVAQVQVIRSTMGDTAYEERIAERISKIQFGAVSGNGYYVFTYPIRFTDSAVDR